MALLPRGLFSAQAFPGLTPPPPPSPNTSPMASSPSLGQMGACTPAYPSPFPAPRVCSEVSFSCCCLSREAVYLQDVSQGSTCFPQHTGVSPPLWDTLYVFYYMALPFPKSTPACFLSVEQDLVPNSHCSPSRPTTPDSFSAKQDTHKPSKQQSPRSLQPHSLTSKYLTSHCHPLYPSSGTQLNR